MDRRDYVMDSGLAALVVNLRELGRSAALFDGGARRIVAVELLVAAARFLPGLRVRRRDEWRPYQRFR